jgi:hypothetical protein
MKVLRRSRRLVRLAGCTALTAGVAGMAVAASAPAQARGHRDFVPVSCRGELG